MRRLNSSCSNSKASAAYWWVHVIRGGVLTLRWSTVLAVISTLLIAQQEGQQQWRFSVGGYITLSSPALSPDGTAVYVGVDTGTGGRVIAASTRDGAARWSSRVFTELIESSPTVAADGTIYVGCGDGMLYALEPANGAVRWGVSLGGFVSSSPALASDGTLYVGAGDGRLHAITSGGGRLWTFPTDDVIFSSPAIGADGTIYFGSFDQNLYAVTPAGQKKWEFATNGPIFSSPAIGADGTIYFGSGDQRLYAVTPDGAKKWDFVTLGPVDASPTLGADGTIYVASDRNLYALRPGDDGERLRWKRDIGSGSISSAAVRGDGVIIFGADNGVVRALNPDGRERWPFDTRTGQGNLIESSPIVAPDGSIYIGSYDGALYKINGNGSPLSAYSAWPAFRREMRHTGHARLTNAGGKLVNISTRAQAGEAGGARNLIVGFVAQATPGQRRAYLIRAVGPGLQARNVAGFIPDPRLRLFAGESTFQVNDNWLPNDEFFGFSLPDTAAAVQAFPLEPGSADAAILPALPGGVFTAHVTSSDTRSGVALVEVYDGLAGDSAARLLNLSTRGFVGTDENILIAGFVVGGTGSMRLLLRAIGPGLTQFSVPGAIAQPRLTLFSGNTELASNTGWTSGGFQNDLFVAGASVSAFSLAPTSADSAVLFDATPGAYTIQISGVGGSTGEAMVEIYVLP